MNNENCGMTLNQALRKVAQTLNDADILWGVGASVMLKFHGIVEECHDLDIVVALKDIARAEALLDQMALRIPIPVKEEYVTRHFLTYKLGGVDMDVMSGFRIRHSDGIYEFPMDELSVVSYGEIDGISIPYTSLEDWYGAYRLMIGREWKVDLIKAHLKENAICHSYLLARLLEQDLPGEVAGDIKTLLEETAQIRELGEEDMKADLLDSYSRHQEVTKVWRMEDGIQVIKDIAFVEEWDQEDKAEIIKEILLPALRKGGAVFGAYKEDRLMGFSALDGQMIGQNKDYLQMLEMHISSDVRGQGLGRNLFRRTGEKAKTMGAKKLYISSHSAIETVAFYKSMGCEAAKWLYEKQVALEPCDSQLECLL